MVLLLLAIFIVLSIITYKAFGNNWDMDWIPAVFIVGTMICFVAAIILGICVSTGSTIQSRIDMYAEENTHIENDIAVMVEQYMNYEGQVMDKASGESALTLVNLYPDLKTSELVNQQIQIHTDNNAKIKELREEQINLNVMKWWLYFGGK